MQWHVMTHEVNEVCLRGQCVRLAEQQQDIYCNQPWAECDVDAHVKVMSVCRDSVDALPAKHRTRIAISLRMSATLTRIATRVMPVCRDSVDVLLPAQDTYCNQPTDVCDTDAHCDQGMSVCRLCYRIQCLD